MTSNLTIIMDINRCGFVQFPPQPINALAFSHSSEPRKKSPRDLRLAVGRNNGDVEIWNPQNGLWVQETILKGSKNTTIEQLAWTQDMDVVDAADGAKVSPGPLRLFSTGGSTSVIEWDLSTGSTKRRAEGNFGDIWCFAAQPQAKSKDILQNGASAQLLAAGCSDGTLILFSTEDDDLRYLRNLLTPPVKKPKVLSLTWRDRNTLVAGYEDSTIRVIDVPNRRILRSMSLGKPVEGSNSVVWAVKCLPDGTILSGDSSGELKIWDSKNLSLVQRVKSHKADILDIATSASGDRIFTVGVDRRTVSYHLVAIHSGTQKTRWAEVSHKRFHQHDVKTTASFESKEVSILVSGGMDARLVVVPIRRSQTEYHRALPHLPQRPQISASPASRLFISWSGHDILVYQVRKYRDVTENGFEPEAPSESSYDILSRLAMQGEESIQDAQISEDGQLIVAASISNVKLFQLRKTYVSGRPCRRARQVELPSSIARLGARRVGFSPDGKWLYAIRKDNAIALVKITPGPDSGSRPIIHEKTAKIYRQSRKHPPSALQTYPEAITRIAFSSDSRILAVGDLCGSVDVWLLEGHEDLNFVDAGSDNEDESSDTSSTSSDDDEDEDDSPVIHGQKWIRNPSGSQLPQLDSSILALTFRPSPSTYPLAVTNGNVGLHATRHTPHPVSRELPASDVRLIALTATHTLVEFDVLNSRLSDWSRRNPSAYLPHNFTRIKDRAVGCFWDSSDRANKGERLWLYGSTWLYMLDVSQDLPQEEKVPVTATRIATGEKIGTLGGYDVLEPAEDTRPASLESPTDHEHRPESGRGEKKRKRNAGAGDEMHVRYGAGGVGKLIRKFENTAEDADMIDTQFAPEGQNGGDLEDEEEEEEDEDVLALMRRGQDDHDNATSTKPTRRSHWHTFAYRSILGISVIGAGAGDAPTTEVSHSRETDVSLSVGKGDEESAERRSNSNSNIEVVIVEREMVDVPQLPRFDGGQEWDV